MTVLTLPHVGPLRVGHETEEIVVKNLKRKLASTAAAVGLAAGLGAVAAPAAHAGPPTMTDWQYSTQAKCKQVEYAKLNEAFRSGWLIKDFTPCHKRNGNYWGGTIYYQ